MKLLSLYLNYGWGHGGNMATNEHPFSFYNFIISWFGYSLNVNNFKSKNHKFPVIKKPYKCSYSSETTSVLIDEYFYFFKNRRDVLALCIKIL